MKKIVVGLGNPGSRYEKTRHNIGWMVLDRLADRTGSAGRAKARDGAAIVRGRVDDIELVLVKPTTYMNLSGQAVRKVLARERAPLAELLVVVDDMDLPFGRLRIKPRGSAGGHNGLRSIIGEMGTEAFARLRVGIGSAPRGAVEHVLGDFRAAEQRDLDLVLDAAADAVLLWAEAGAEVAANRWNGWRAGLAEEQALGETGAGAGARTRTGADTPAEIQVPTGSQASAAPPDAVGPDGVVRTRTGWRRLLPGLLKRGPRDPDR